MMMILQKKVKQATGVFIVALLLLAGSGAMAKGPTAVGKTAKVITDSLAYPQLTDAQKTTANGLTKPQLPHVQTGKKAKADTSFRGKALAQQVIGIMKTRNTGLQKILTPDQQKVFQEHKISQIADVQTKVMTAQLDLTDAQVPQVYKINKESTADMMGDMGKLKSAGGKFAKMKAAKGLKGDIKDSRKGV